MMIHKEGFTDFYIGKIIDKINDIQTNDDS